MTIIASLRDVDEGLFLAADGLETEGATGYPLPAEKLAHLAEARVAWGFAGDVGIGDEFGHWMRGEGSRARNWGALKDSALGALTALNGRKRELLQTAKASETDEDTTCVLLVGYLDGHLEILELDSRGGHTFYGGRGNPFYAIGSGSTQARIVHGITSELKPTLFGEKLLRFVMKRAIPISQHCGFPGRVLHVTPDGVTECRSILVNDKS